MAGLPMSRPLVVGRPPAGLRVGVALLGGWFHHRVENHTTLNEAGNRCRPRRGGDRQAPRVLLATHQGTEGATGGTVSGSHA
jgi:hypothetical protein